MNSDISSCTKAGSVWVGQSSPGISRAGGVEGWMLALAARSPAGTRSAIYPAASLVQRLEELGWGWKEAGSPMAEADVLYIPDLQVDVGDGFDLSHIQFAKIASLIAHRREAGSKTFVGVQNPHKLSKGLLAEIFGYLQLRKLEDINLPLNPSSPPKAVGPIVALKPGRRSFKDVASALSVSVY
jgi:hypothetical protein